MPSEAARIINTGYVGIGTNSPTALLTIHGRTQFTDAGSTPSAGAGLEIYGGATPILLAYDRGGTSFLPLEFDASEFRFDISNSRAMTIDTSGKVGIGTTDPDRLLHMYSGVAGAYIDDVAQFILEDEDARIQLKSSNAGSNGSALILSNATSS